MEIKKGVLLSVSEADLENGLFYNDEVVEVGEDCFINMKSLVKLILPKCIKITSSIINNAALTTLSLPVCEVVKYSIINNAALTTLSLPVCEVVNSSIRDNAALTTLIIGVKKLDVKNVDGTCFVIVSEKSTKGIKIYTGYNLISVKNKIFNKENCFLSEKDNFFAHGDTIKKSISDLQFKIVSEKLKKEPIHKDTIISVNYYRLITGSCEQGVISWMKQNNVTKEEITAFELLPLLEKSRAYGLERFKSLITF